MRLLQYTFAMRPRSKSGKTRFLFHTFHFYFCGGRSMDPSPGMKGTPVQGSVARAGIRRPGIELHV